MVICEEKRSVISQTTNPLHSKCYRSLDGTMRMLLIFAFNESEGLNYIGLLQKQSQ